ncbi:MAG: histidine kinase [Deltaproteobacteria bacterium]|nr:histidine kinase [Deltaproteobacteria bacterium]
MTRTLHRAGYSRVMPAPSLDDRAPIPRVLAVSALVLAPIILLAFEPEGVRHPWPHQARSLIAVWLYAIGVVATLHLGTEIVSRAFDRRARDGLAPSSLALGVVVSIGGVALFSIPAAPVLASVCPGIAGHETALVVRGVLLGLLYAVVGLSLGHTFRGGLAARMAKERAERSAIEARLTALTARTQPHFLANALNTIAQTLREDPDRAERLVEDLGGLFGHTLAASPGGRVALTDELEAARSYLAVQSARFGARLSFDVVSDMEDETLSVPVLSIVPLVENAVLHGLSASSAPVRVELRVSRGAHAIIIEVQDDGPGPSGTEHVGHGKGLAELRERLALLHPRGDASISLERAGDVTVARLVLPLGQTEAHA